MDSSLRGKDLSLLGKSKSLRSLRVAGSKLDEAPLASVAKIRSLDSLNIFNCRLTSGGQHVLVSLANVQSLSLRQTVLEDEPLARLLAGLERAENLRLLELAMPSLEDRDVPRLARLRQLLALGVNLNNLGDASIPEFATMNHLDQLDVSGTLITSDGLTQLEAALPDCRIIHHDRRANIPQLSLAEVLSLRQEKDRIAALIRDIGGEVELDSLQPASEGR